MQIDNTLALNSYNDISANKIKNANAKQDALLKEQTDAFEAFMVKAVLDIALKEDDKNSLYEQSFEWKFRFFRTFIRFFEERLLSKFIFCRCSDINILF